MGRVFLEVGGPAVSADVLHREQRSRPAQPSCPGLLAPVVILLSPLWVLLNAIQVWLRLSAWLVIVVFATGQSVWDTHAIKIRGRSLDDPPERPILEAP